MGASVASLAVASTSAQVNHLVLESPFNNLADEVCLHVQLNGVFIATNIHIFFNKPCTERKLSILFRSLEHDDFSRGDKMMAHNLRFVSAAFPEIKEETFCLRKINYQTFAK